MAPHRQGELWDAEKILGISQSPKSPFNCLAEVRDSKIMRQCRKPINFLDRIVMLELLGQMQKRRISENFEAELQRISELSACRSLHRDGRHCQVDKILELLCERLEMGRSSLGPNNQKHGQLASQLASHLPDPDVMPNLAASDQPHTTSYGRPSLVATITETPIFSTRSLFPGYPKPPVSRVLFQSQWKAQILSQWLSSQPPHPPRMWFTPPTTPPTSHSTFQSTTPQTSTIKDEEVLQLRTELTIERRKVDRLTAVVKKRASGLTDAELMQELEKRVKGALKPGGKESARWLLHMMQELWMAAVGAILELAKGGEDEDEVDEGL